MHFFIYAPFLWLLSSVSAIPSANTLETRQSATEVLLENTYQTIGPMISDLGRDIKSWASLCYRTESPLGALIKTVEQQQRIAGVMNQAADRIKQSGSMTLSDTFRNDDWVPELTITVIDTMKSWITAKEVVNQVGQGQTVLSSLLEFQKATDNFRWAVQNKLPLSVGIRDPFHKSITDVDLFQMTLAWNQDRKTQLAVVGQAIKAFQLF